MWVPCRRTARSLTPDTALSARSPKQMLQVAFPLWPSGTLAILMRFKFERKTCREGRPVDTAGLNGGRVGMVDVNAGGLSNVGIKGLVEGSV